jgi:hypothetical protein
LIQGLERYLAWHMVAGKCKRNDKTAKASPASHEMAANIAQNEDLCRGMAEGESKPQKGHSLGNKIFFCWILSNSGHFNRSAAG